MTVEKRTRRRLIEIIITDMLMMGLLILNLTLIIFDWTSEWLRVLKLDADGKIVFNEPWLGRHRFIHPSDMAIDKDGHVWLLEYGTPWYDGTDGKLKRISY